MCSLSTMYTALYTSVMYEVSAALSFKLGVLKCFCQSAHLQGSLLQRTAHCTEYLKGTLIIMYVAQS